VWFTGLDVPIGHSVIIATTEPLTLDYERLRTRMQLPAIRSDLAEVGIDMPEGLLAHFITDERGLKSFLESSLLNTDNHAITAFPDALPSPTRWATNLSNLLSRRMSLSFTKRSADVSQTYQALSSGALWLMQAAIAISAGNIAQADAWIDHVIKSGIEVEKLGAAFSSTLEPIMAAYLAECERAIAGSDTASARSYLERAGMLTQLEAGGNPTMSRAERRLNEMEKLLSR
ncbi:hypothetical protein MJD09_27725, partial [bacterium]|nr:hypothetical protein [bacterium]